MNSCTKIDTLRVISLVILSIALMSATVWAQEPILPLGDSITQGGNGYASYRYSLWFELEQGGYNVEFVGDLDETHDGSPNLAWYPDYFGTFDRDHEGHWGWRTDVIAGIVAGAVAASQPTVVLLHLGTNDVGQLGVAGVANADTYLRQIINNMRSVQPTLVILLAQVIPIGPGSGYSVNAEYIAPLNAAIADIASEETTPESPIILVDQHSGYDLDTMMQPDGLHPNLAGENQIAQTWYNALANLVFGTVDEDRASWGDVKALYR